MKFRRLTIAGMLVFVASIGLGAVTNAAPAVDERAFCASMEAAFGQISAMGPGETRVCVPGACGWCKISIIPPKAHCQISTPSGGCSGWCDASGCGTNCW